MGWTRQHVAVGRWSIPRQRGESREWSNRRILIGAIVPHILSLLIAFVRRCNASFVGLRQVQNKIDNVTAEIEALTADRDGLAQTATSASSTPSSSSSSSRGSSSKAQLDSGQAAPPPSPSFDVAAAELASPNTDATSAVTKQVELLQEAAEKLGSGPDAAAEAGAEAAGVAAEPDMLSESPLVAPQAETKVDPTTAAAMDAVKSAAAESMDALELEELADDVIIDTAAGMSLQSEPVETYDTHVMT